MFIITIIMENQKPYSCQLCNKSFSSSSSLSNHKRIYHIDTKDNKRNKNNNDDLYHCRYCEKSYTVCNSRWRHEKKCTSKNNETNVEDNTENLINETLMNENKLLTEKCDNLKDEVISLQSKLINNLLYIQGEVPQPQLF